MPILKTLQTLGAAFVLFAGTALADAVDSAPSRSWSELSEMYELPSWFAEGKLGVWVHWGPQAVPAKGGGWYARSMYMHPDIAEPSGKDAFDFHREHFGHQADFGYKDILNE